MEKETQPIHGEQHQTAGGEPSRTINSYRRNLIKFLLVGGGAFLLGKFTSPFINFLNRDKVLDEKIFNNFKIVETGRTLKVFDKEGSEILLIDKDSL